MRKCFVLFVLSLSLLAVNAQSYSPSRVVTDTIKSEVLGVNRAYTVYLPQNFDNNIPRNYPVLYLLHGMWEKNDVWANRGHLKEVMDRLVASG